MSRTSTGTQQSSSLKLSSKCTLIPINLHDAEEFETIRQQRIECGWNFEPSIIAGWRDKMDEKTKSLFWITVPANGNSVEPIKAGHISLDSVGEPPDPDFCLARPDKTLLTISTFFILPSQRSGGLGRSAVQILERWAREEPYGSEGCRAIAVNTLSRYYIEDEEGRKLWRKIGKEPPKKGGSNEEWYERMGYVKFKEEGRYKAVAEDGSGEVIFLRASFLRKELT